MQSQKIGRGDTRVSLTLRRGRDTDGITYSKGKGVEMASPTRRGGGNRWHHLLKESNWVFSFLITRGRKTKTLQASPIKFRGKGGGVASRTTRIKLFLSLPEPMSTLSAKTGIDWQLTGTN